MNRFYFLLLTPLIFCSCFKTQQTNVLGNYKITKTENIKIDSNNAIITGFFKEMATNEPISDNRSSILVNGTAMSASVDSTGFFEITLKPGDYTFDIRYFLFWKMQTKKIKLLPNTKTHLEIKLNTYSISCG
jgi:hypothetical protein